MLPAASPLAPFAHAGETAAVATACCWVVGAMSFEAAGKRIGSLPLNLIRLLMAFGLLALLNRFRLGDWLPMDAPADTWLWLTLSGLVGFTLGDLCLFRAYVLLGARLSTLLMALTPLFTALFGRWFLGEVLTLRDLSGMALVVSGVSWAVLERVPDDTGRGRRVAPAGLLLGLGSAMGQALGLIFSKLGMGDYDAFGATQIRVIAGTLGFCVLIAMVGWWPRTMAALRDRSGMKFAAIGAVFGPFIGVGLSLVAVKYTQTGVAATLMALLPVLIIPPSVLIKKERVSPRAVVGAAVAVAGAVLLFS